MTSIAYARPTLDSLPPRGRARDVMIRIMSKARGATSKPRRVGATSAASRLFEAERLFQDFKELTPYRYRPFTKCFDSFAEYERWKRAQKNPWYR